MNSNLSLPEQLVLLYLDETSGHLRDDFPPAALTMAALAELVLQERVRLEEDRIAVTDTTPTGDRAPDIVLDALARERRHPSTAVHLCRSGVLLAAVQAATLDRLVERGILARVDERHWWMFHHVAYPTVDHLAPHDLRSHLRDTALNASDDSARVRTLVALLQNDQALGLVLSAEELEAHAETITRLTRDAAPGAAVCRILQRMRDEEALAADVTARTTEAMIAVS